MREQKYLWMSIGILCLMLSVFFHKNHVNNAEAQIICIPKPIECDWDGWVHIRGQLTEAESDGTTAVDPERTGRFCCQGGNDTVSGVLVSMDSEALGPLTCP